MKSHTTVKTLTVACAALLLLITLMSCQRGENDIVIGAALPLTGTTSYYGEDSKRGIDLALDEINAAGGVQGRKLKVIYEDTQGSGNQAINAVRKLISADNVPVIIGCGTSTETMAVAPIVEQNKRVLITPVSSAASISRAGQFVFRSVPSDGLQARDLAAWIRELNYRRVSLIFVNQTWGVGLKDDFVREFQSRGGEILTMEATDLDEKDFRTQLTNMKAKNPEAYVAIIYAKEGGVLLKQARELGITTQFFGADPWTKQQLADGAGQAADGVLFTTPAKYQGPEFNAFADKYRKRYGKEPGVYDAHGYDCMKLVARAMQDGGLSGPEVQAAMAKIKGFQGVTGESTFDENGDVTTKGFARMTWSGGVLQPAQTQRAGR
jgi:branched-chain amino acid transport system substrate-binding protein